MNKKERPIEIEMDIVVMILMIIGILIGTFYLHKSVKSKIEVSTKVNYEECFNACNKLNYEFLQNIYSGAGWGKEIVKDCFCKDGNNSIQIY